MVELTQKEYDALEAELAELKGPKRAEAVEAIATARGFGDLSENFEYHAAKDAQGLLERQITVLEEKHRNAVIVKKPPAASGVIAVGSKVELTDADGDTLRVVISNGGGNGAVAPDSALGAALLGASSGQTVSVKAPGGVWKATIQSVS
jgi:transcription elongation factor GreA